MRGGGEEAYVRTCGVDQDLATSQAAGVLKYTTQRKKRKEPRFRTAECDSSTHFKSNSQS